MCIVLAPLAVAGITAAMTAASVAMQQVAASKEHAAAVTRSNLETDVANQSALRQYGALGRRESEESAQAANEITKITRESENASGQFSVEAAAGNVAGQSVDLMRQDFARRQAEEVANTLYNRRAQRSQNADNLAGIQSGQQAAYISATPSAQKQVDYIGAGLNVFSGAAKAGVFNSPATNAAQTPAPK